MTTTTRFLRWIGFVASLLGAMTGAVAVGASLFFFVVAKDLPSIPEPLTLIIETPPTEIFAANGERIVQLGGREYQPLDQVARPFIQAILAVEDHRFWEHHGVNKFRTLKALWVTLFSRGAVQGASTITQQLAKNLFFSFDQTWSRKFRELLVALQIESQFSKQEILEAYINQIYIAPLVRGVGPAARLYFGKSAGQLSLSEAALLAGLPKSPTRYNPLRFPERARQRQMVVIRRMVAAGFISDQQARAVLDEPLTFARVETPDATGGYFVDWVLKQLEQTYGTQVVYHGGLKVTTTMDPHMQQLAREAVSKGILDLEKVIKDSGTGGTIGEESTSSLQGALVAVQVNSGAVKAMVGGRNYAQSEFNRATESNRLAGSSFKPFVYYSAFEKLGFSPASVIVDEPVHIPIAGTPDWHPENFKRQYLGPVILKKAFTESLNSVAAQLILRTGPEAVIDVAHRCGITGNMTPVYSLALGTVGVSPLDMAGAFATFAGGGVHYSPFGIWRVEDAFGQVLEEHIVSGQKVLNEQICFQITDMMQGVVDYGTGEAVRRMGFEKPVGGKTGTTNEYMDAWFTGFTPTISASVWVGYDQPNSLKDAYGVGITGGRGAAPIWTRFMLKATDGDPSRPFLHPSGIEMQAVDSITGQPVAADTPGAIPVVMRRAKGVLPNEMIP